MTFNPAAAPAAPNTAQPATFQSDADAFAAWMSAFGSGINGAGGLLTPGDFGLGGTSKTAPNNDLNQCGTVSGLYHAENSTANRPASAANLLVYHLARADDTVAQIAVGRAAHDLYIRYQNPSIGWSEWVSVLPLRGSNANGEFVRFADGTQICTGTILSVDIDTTAGGIFRSSALNAGFSAAFVAPPAVSGSVASTVGAWCNVRATSETALALQAYSYLSRTGDSVRYIAVGRWK